MINGLFDQSNYVAAKKMLDATVLRHEAIASNLANLETPNYKRLDVAPSFQTELRSALEGKNPSQISSLHPQITTDPNAVASATDGNSVQLENELLQMNKNFIEHALETQLVTGNLLKLRLAITGRAA
jgi:flagellar basal-body rod protein FlgB